MEYDPNTGRMLKGTDVVGNTTTLLRDLAGRVTQATDPLGFSNQISVSPIDQVTQVACEA